MARGWLSLLIALGAASCTTQHDAAPPEALDEPDGGEPDAGRDAAPWKHGAYLEPSRQEPGDAERGRDLLLNGSYMGCGIPLTLWDSPLLGAVIQPLLGTDGVTELEGRTGRNASLPHTLNAFTTSDGAEVVNRNCLMCHSGKFDGELIIGLGNASADFTRGIANGLPVGVIPDAALQLLDLTDAERSNLKKMLRTASVFGPETAMRTVGQNPAEAFTGILLAHHDLETLEWSDVPLRPLVVRDEAGEPMVDPRLTSDAPPWWRAKKKNALFYNGMARGDHRGTMALATAICVDNVAEAERIDALFRDIQAFIGTLRAPAYPRAIDDELAAEGETIYAATCVGCHGTYAADASDDAADTYPNLLIPLDVIGTDPAVANMGVVHAPEFVEWYNESFYGETTRAVPDDPFPGYMPPPLDGIWATAPFLHNGSVPTVALVLNSKARPGVWRRVDFDDTHFDEDALGWPWAALPHSQAEAPEAERKYLYDTSYWSQSNAGHTFGDHLSDAERRAVIEYLKTL
jgi:mono/diheme cytochrome c family protein